MEEMSHGRSLVKSNLVSLTQRSLMRPKGSVPQRYLRFFTHISIAAQMSRNAAYGRPPTVRKTLINVGIEEVGAVSQGWSTVSPLRVDIDIKRLEVYRVARREKKSLMGKIGKRVEILKSVGLNGGHRHFLSLGCPSGQTGYSGKRL